MFAALKTRLKALASLPDRLDAAAVAVATAQRGKVKARKRGAAKRRKALRLSLRLRGFSAREVRARVRKGRKGSGISIDARATADGVVLTASDQVNHFRRVRGENDDIMRVFREAVFKLAAKGSR